MKTIISVVFAVLLVMLPAVPAASADEGDNGPDVIIKAAEQAAYADTLVLSCRYDEAEYWIKKALQSARETHSVNTLVRDTAGSFVGRLEIKLREFRSQRELWASAVSDARHLIAINRLESARMRIDGVGAPSCDPRLTELKDEIRRRTGRAAALVRLGDRDLRGSPESAQTFYLQARAIDPEMPGIQVKLADAKSRAPKRCIGCKFAKIVLFTAIAGGLGYGSYYGYQKYEQKQRATR